MHPWNTLDARLFLLLLTEHISYVESILVLVVVEKDFDFHVRFTIHKLYNTFLEVDR